MNYIFIILCFLNLMKWVSGKDICALWPNSASWNSRRILCSQYPYYTTTRGDSVDSFCECSENVFISGTASELSASKFSVDVPTIILSNRPHSLLKCLMSVRSAVGGQSATVTVISQEKDKEIELLTSVFETGYNLTHSPVHEEPGLTISHLYGTALHTSLLKHRNSTLFIILEDDLVLSPDFYTYMSDTAPMLLKDASLYCVSAHNDISYSHTSYDEEVALRTDSYSKLGWMAPRSYIKELANYIKDYYPGDFEPYDWDVSSFNHIRKGRECIIPEISRSKHVIGESSTHVSTTTSLHYFDKKNYNQNPNSKIRGVENLEKHSYEKHILDMISKAIFIDPKESNPCMPNFTALHSNKSRTFLMFFHLPHTNKVLSRDYSLLARCLGIYPISLREGHKDLYRLRLGTSHLFLVGYPRSPYSKYRPAKLPIFNYSDQFEKMISSPSNTWYKDWQRRVILTFNKYLIMNDSDTL